MTTTTIDRPVQSAAEILRNGTVEKTCQTCGKEFALAFPTRFADLVNVCPECSEVDALARQAEIIRNSKALRKERWKRICPPDFLDTVPGRLPNPKKYSQVMDWQYGPRGLVLHGETGAGKSRCAWLLLKREFEAGRCVASVNASAGLTYAAKYDGGADDVKKWIDRLSNIDLLLLDDVFKSKLTDSFEAAVFTIVLNRTEGQKPIILTANDTGATLLTRLSPDRGEPLIRRLKEFCTPIGF